MAISYETTSSYSNVAGAGYSTRTFSTTITTSSFGAMVIFSANTSAVDITSITFNGVAMTKALATAGSLYRLETWYLLNPAVGTQNVVINWSSNILADLGLIPNINGVKQTGQPDATSSKTQPFGTGPTISDTITLNSDNCLYFAAAFSGAAVSLLDSELGLTSIDVGSHHMQSGYLTGNTGAHTISSSVGGFDEVHLHGIAFSPNLSTGFDPLLLLDY